MPRTGLIQTTQGRLADANQKRAFAFSERDRRRRRIQQILDERLQFQVRRAEQNRSKGHGLGAIGTGAGAALGAILAAPTGGLSIAAGAAIGAGAGGAIGSSIDGSPNPGPATTSALADVAEAIPSRTGLDFINQGGVSAGRMITSTPQASGNVANRSLIPHQPRLTP